MNGTVVSNQILLNGMHQAEIICFGKPLDVDEWAIQLIPEHVLDTFTFWDWIEKEGGLNLQHLQLFWRIREPADFSLVPGAELKSGILYWISPGETLRSAASEAARLHKEWCGKMPSTAWVRKLPKGAIEVIDAGEGAKMALQAAEWVRNGFVVVGIQDQNLLTTKDTKNTEGSAK